MPSTNTLTPKQEEVLSLLADGVKPPAIAKKLKISTSGVYGHMRNMRRAGVTLPTEDLSALGAQDHEAKVAASADNGRPPTPEEFIAEALHNVQEQVREREALIKDAEGVIERTRGEIHNLVVRVEKLDKAQQALA